MEWHGIGLGAAFILGTTAMIWGVYWIARRTVAHRAVEDTRDLAGSVIFRVAALHGLILALVFAQELADYNDIRSDLVDEAIAIADIYNDARRYGAPELEAMQQSLTDYVHHVVEAEWQTLGRTGKLTDEGWQYREVFYLAALDLEPQNLREADLRAHMVENAQLIAALRQQRENSAVHDMGGMFWVAAFAGLVLVAMPYFTFSPTPLHILLLGVYSGFSGLIIFMIFAFSNPFASPGAIAPVAFERLLETEIGG